MKKFSFQLLIILFVFQLASCGGGGSGSGENTTPTPPANVAPTANAGDNQEVDENTLVTLSGSGSDSDGTISSYSWTQTGGTSVTINNADEATATFDAPNVNADETLTFALTVTDNDGATGSNSVDINILDTNQAPTIQIMNALTVDEGEIVHLDASATDDGSIESQEWIQTSGFNVDLITMENGNIEFKAPLVDEQTDLSFDFIVSDNEGKSASSSVVITIKPVVETYSSVSSNLILPEGNSTIDTTKVTYISTVSETLEVSEKNDKSTLLIAKDEQGSLFLAVANKNGGFQSESNGEVIFNNKSSAIALISVAAGFPIYNISESIAQTIIEHTSFSSLVSDLDDLMEFDKNYLDNIYDYENIVSKIKLIAADIKSATTAQQSAANVKTFTSRSVKTPYLNNYQQTFANSEFNDDYWCVINPWLCSPWYNNEPWTWYGEAQGANAFNIELTATTAPKLIARSLFPGGFLAYIGATGYTKLLAETNSVPFIAVSEKDTGVHAIANPNMANYIAEFYSGDTLKSWYVLPRNSTIIQKLLNSGAAYRQFNTKLGAKELSSDIDRILIKKYFVSPEIGLDRSLLIRVVNGMNLLFTSINIVSDLSEVSSVFQKVIASSSDDINTVLACSLTVGAEFDFYFDSQSGGASEIFAFAQNNIGNILETMLTSNDCQDMFLNIGRKALPKLLAKQAIKSSLDALATYNPFTGWVRLAFDGANDFAPVFASIFDPYNEVAEYHLEWSSNNNIDYITNVSSISLPTAKFSYSQKSGYILDLDASASSAGNGSGLSYSWQVDGSSINKSGRTISYDFGKAGTYQIALTVEDSEGNQADYVQSVSVSNGSAPIIDSLQCIGYTNKTAQFTAQFSDADNDMVTVNWYTSIYDTEPSLITDANQNTATLTYETDKNFAYSKVEVVDSQGHKTFKNCFPKFENELGSSPVDGLIAYYPFNGNAKDASGNNLDGAVEGGAVITNDYLDLNNEYIGRVRVSDNEKLDITGNLTVSAWVTREGRYHDNHPMIVAKGVNQSFLLWPSMDKTFLEESELAFRVVINNVNYTVYSGQKLEIGTKYHVVGVRKDSTLAIYVDGKLRKEIDIPNGSIDVSNYDLTIGDDHLDGSRGAFNGVIDEVRIYNRAISASEVTALYRQVNTQGLIAYYSFDGNADDSSGNGNDGVEIGTVNYSTGVKGQAVDLSNSYVKVDGTGPLFDGVKTFSLSIWAKPNGTGYGTLFSQRIEGGNDWRTQFGIWRGIDNIPYLRVYGIDQDGNYTTVTAKAVDTMTDKTHWYHIVGVYDGTFVKIYVDGKLLNSVPYSDPIRTVPGAYSLIGFNPSAQYWYGELDEARVYNRALSETEVTALYQQGNTQGLIAYYPFDGNADDASGNGNDGQVNGQISYSTGLNNLSVNFDNGPSQSLFYTNEWISGTTKLSFQELTASLWVNFDSSVSTDGASIFSIGSQTNSSGNSGVNIMVLNDGELRASARNGTNGYGLGVVSPVYLDTGKWHHVAIVLSSSKFQMFLDGILVDEKNITSSLSFSNLKWFFALHEWDQSNSRSSRFDGRLDEVRIFNRPLTSEEIRVLSLN